MMLELKNLKSNNVRGFVAWLSMCFIIPLGASSLWGLGGGVLAVGIALFIDATIDEVVERITLIKRV